MKANGKKWNWGTLTLYIEGDTVVGQSIRLYGSGDKTIARDKGQTVWAPIEVKYYLEPNKAPRLWTRIESGYKGRYMRHVMYDYQGRNGALKEINVSYVGEGPKFKCYAVSKQRF